GESPYFRLAGCLRFLGLVFAGRCVIGLRDLDGQDRRRASGGPLQFFGEFLTDSVDFACCAVFRETVTSGEEVNDLSAVAVRIFDGFWIQMRPLREDFAAEEASVVLRAHNYSPL